MQARIENEKRLIKQGLPPLVGLQALYCLAQVEVSIKGGQVQCCDTLAAPLFSW